MKLLAIRDFNENDPLPGLGPKVERKPETPAPAPVPSPSNPNILIGPDGKMSTDIPENKQAGFILYWDFDQLVYGYDPRS